MTVINQAISRPIQPETNFIYRLRHVHNRMVFFWEIFKISMASIWAHKLRAFLTLLGIIIGVASVVAVGASIEGFRVYVTSTITKTLGANTFFIAKIARTGHMSREEWERLMLTHKNVKKEEMFAVERNCPECATVGIMQRGRWTSDVKNQSLVFYDANILGATANITRIQNIDLEDGRFFNENEVTHSHFICVIGTDIRDKLFPGQNALGKTVKFLGYDFTVAGVEARKGTFMGQSQDNLIWIPISTYEKLYGILRNISIRVKTSDESTFQTAQEQARVALRAFRKLRPNAEDTFDIQSPQGISDSVGQFTGAIAAVVTPITLISLLVGGIVVMNIMLVSVTERTKEIGLRKSIGARQVDILLQFILESVVLSSVGGFLGLLFAYVIAIVVTNTTPVPMSISIGYILLSLLVSGGIGLIFGIYPAYRAAKLDPIVALQKE